jgi:hypothetical protein
MVKRGQTATFAVLALILGTALVAFYIRKRNRKQWQA